MQDSLANTHFCSIDESSKKAECVQDIIKQIKFKILFQHKLAKTLIVWKIWWKCETYRKYQEWNFLSNRRDILNINWELMNDWHLEFFLIYIFLFVY
jgi:hypothetical protein